MRGGKTTDVTSTGFEVHPYSAGWLNLRWPADGEGIDRGVESRREGNRRGGGSPMESDGEGLADDGWRRRSRAHETSSVYHSSSP